MSFKRGDATMQVAAVATTAGTTWSRGRRVEIMDLAGHDRTWLSHSQSEPVLKPL